MLWYFHIVLIIAMILCDGIWIFLNYERYTHNISMIQNTESHEMWAIMAIPIYVLMYVAVVFIALPLYPLYDIGAGALVGCVVYGVYDLCVLLQFHRSSVKVALMDMVWGTVLFMGLTKIAMVFDGV